MAEGKNFLIRIELDIHSVDYRYKNLNYLGNIALRVHALSSTAVTIPATPHFPVHLREKLIFEKVVDGMKSLGEIEENLDGESVRMELVQWPGHFSGRLEVLAHFRTKLSEILFQDFSEKGNLKVRLEPVDKPPGTFGGSLQVSTKMIVAELTGFGARKSRKQEAISDDAFPCCRSVISRNTCSCVVSAGRDKKKFRSVHKIPGKSNGRLSQSEKIICRNNCSICKSYFGYFHREPFSDSDRRFCRCRKAREHSETLKPNTNFELVSPISPRFSENFSTKSRCIRGGPENPIPYRQLFYENLDLSYRDLGEKIKWNRPFLYTGKTLND